MTELSEVPEEKGKPVTVGAAINHNLLERQDASAFGTGKPHDNTSPYLLGFRAMTHDKSLEISGHRTFRAVTNQITQCHDIQENTVE